MRQEIKLAFRRLFDLWNNGTLNAVHIDITENQITKLFPKWRYPEKDGWPSINLELILVCLNDGRLIVERFGMFDERIKRKDVEKWIPIFEILKFMEVNK